MSKAAKQGDTVKIHYTAKTVKEIIFDSKRQDSPLEVTIGEADIIPAFEDALVGMAAGEKKTIHVVAEEAFGPYLKELISTIDRAQIPPNVKLQVGQQLQIQQSDGTPIIVTVADLNDSKVTFDANHPLAGKDLTFDINLLEIK